MYKNRSADGKCNLCGQRIAHLRARLDPPSSQRGLADRMQLAGIDLDKNAIQRIECGKRFVTDIELRAFAEIFGITADELLRGEEPNIG
ncbi:MAG: helix-turn-helix transcriptional regulator [Eubacteriales bacterium]|nr:helix-turn-helix transcriptional regulator [Eubacteriales bacterium]